MTSRPLILIGPSGAGKTTLAHCLSKLLDMPIFVTTTTRPPRDNNDTSHEFVDATTFERLEQSDKLIGLVNAFGFRYGLRQFPKNKNVIMEFRANVIPRFKQEYPNSFIVEVDAPLDVLKTRLQKRKDLARLQVNQLQQEVIAGRHLANLSVSSTRPVDIIAQDIVKAYGLHKVNP